MTTQEPTDELLQEILGEYIDRRAAGEADPLDELCRAHPALEQQLRKLAPLADGLLERLPSELGGSLATRLGERFGPGVDPQVTLEDERPGPDEISAEVLSRLAGRGPGSTRYRIRGEVAHGGMGAVLRVWDEDLRRNLAMKVMLGRGVPDEDGATPEVSPRALARFLEEAQVTGQLDHPGIVPVHELGLDAQGQVYFTMKLVRGMTLHDVLDQLARSEGGWTQARVLGLLLKVCEAMSYAHAKGVVHRDLKPTNVMVGRFGEVFVMDWGLAKVLGREDRKDIRPQPAALQRTAFLRTERLERTGETPDGSLITMDGDVVGTPAYMPPEQAAGDLDAMGPHSDVYSLGAMLYQLLAGQMPYKPPGVQASNHAVWQLVLQGPPRPLRELAPSTPGELVAICERAMARDPRARYADMSALAEDLSAYLEGRVVRAYEAGAWAEARKWMQRNRPLAASLAAAIVLALGGLGAVGFVQARERAIAETERRRADAAAIEAQRNAELARAEQRRAEEQTAKVLRLSDAKVLQQLELEASGLWPPLPGLVPALESWLTRAGALASGRARHEENLLALRAAAHPWTPQDREQDRSTHPRSAELDGKRAALEGLIDRIESGTLGILPEEGERQALELEQEIDALTGEVESRRTWRFDSPEDQWQHDLLAELVERLEALETGLLSPDGMDDRHGWSVPRRLALARGLEAGFAPGGAHERAWSAALPALREAYPGLELAPQVGLVPIGPDPRSELWEFAHLLTGQPPRRGADGQLELSEASGVVLVLMPGGTFWMGAQAADPEGPNHDPLAQLDEAPVHEVELSAFFLSKYEMTQAQWLRLTGTNPSFIQETVLTPTLLHPVEQVSWFDCTTWLARVGLGLPSEAQWEYGARGGTRTPWWTGTERTSLRSEHAANLADRSARPLQARWQDAIEDWPELDDGYAVHAPVGTYAPNPFGLHEVTGNLFEWCLDAYIGDFYQRSPRRDPVAVWHGEFPRVSRGGGFLFTAAQARSAYRFGDSPGLRGYGLGVRPARDVAP